MDKMLQQRNNYDLPVSLLLPPQFIPLGSKCLKSIRYLFMFCVAAISTFAFTQQC